MGLGVLAIPIAAFAFWVWTWGKDIPYINQEPGQRWREKARQAARKRSKALDQSSIAWKAGEKGTAKTLSERGKQFGRQVDRYNERAAKEIFLNLNARYYEDPPVKIDLHGLFVNEALIYAQGHIDRCRQEGVGETKIITGRGNNSKDGIAKIKPAVEGLLIREGLGDKYVWENEGAMVVTVPIVERKPFVSRDSGCTIM
ncbi:Smr domain-containing protein [Ceratobasidium sp. AG-Ba]|nr:Smr domain-containing protein [Ceratobasidium sp. AG-Ba]